MNRILQIIAIGALAISPFLLLAEFEPNSPLEAAYGRNVGGTNTQSGLQKAKTQASKNKNSPAMVGYTIGDGAAAADNNSAAQRATGFQQVTADNDAVTNAAVSQGTSDSNAAIVQARNTLIAAGYSAADARKMVPDINTTPAQPDLNEDISHSAGIVKGTTKVSASVSALRNVRPLKYKVDKVNAIQRKIVQMEAAQNTRNAFGTNENFIKQKAMAQLEIMLMIREAAFVKERPSAVSTLTTAAGIAPNENQIREYLAKNNGDYEKTDIIVRQLKTGTSTIPCSTIYQWSASKGYIGNINPCP